MKRCARCGKYKADEEFNWRWKDKGVRPSIGRSCQVGDQRDWYENNTAEEKSLGNCRTVYLRIPLQLHLCRLWRIGFCSIDLRSRSWKEKKDISRMAAEGYFIGAIKAEIRLCEVVCFNCHMRRENERRSGGRFRRFWPKMPWEK